MLSRSLLTEKKRNLIISFYILHLRDKKVRGFLDSTHQIEERERERDLENQFMHLFLNLIFQDTEISGSSLKINLIVKYNL